MSRYFYDCGEALSYYRDMRIMNEDFSRGYYGIHRDKPSHHKYTVTRLDMERVLKSARLRMTKWQCGALEMYFKYGDYPNTHFYNKAYEEIFRVINEELIKAGYIDKGDSNDGLS